MLVILNSLGTVRIADIIGPDVLVLTEATSNSRCGASHGGAGGGWPPMNSVAAV
jgi:hypothetical protein